MRSHVNKQAYDEKAISIKTGAKAAGSGFTLLELLISMVILSISFLAIIPLLMNTMNLNKTTDMATVARDLASQKVEELMSTDSQVISNWLGANQSYGAVEYVTPKGVVSTTATSATTYTRTWSVNRMPVRDVTVTPVPVALTSVVEYMYKGQTRSRSFTTMWSF